MKRALKRIATAAVALPLAVGLGAGTANASQSVTVPGCYGGGTNATVVCDLTISVGVPAGVETYQTTVPVCIGTCQYVPVTLARVTSGDPVQVCYSYRTLSGTTTGSCFSGSSADPWINFVLQAVENAINTVNDTINTVGDRVNYYYYRTCYIVNNVLDDFGAQIYC